MRPFQARNFLGVLEVQVQQGRVLRSMFGSSTSSQWSVNHNLGDFEIHLIFLSLDIIPMEPEPAFVYLLKFELKDLQFHEPSKSTLFSF